MVKTNALECTSIRVYIFKCSVVFLITLIQFQSYGQLRMGRPVPGREARFKRKAGSIENVTSAPSGLFMARGRGQRK